MPLRVGTARKIVDATAADHGLIAVVVVATPNPGFWHVLVSILLATAEARKELLMRRAKTWSVQLSMTELDLAREAAFPHVF